MYNHLYYNRNEVITLKTFLIPFGNVGKYMTYLIIKRKCTVKSDFYKKYYKYLVDSILLNDAIKSLNCNIINGVLYVERGVKLRKFIKGVKIWKQ